MASRGEHNIGRKHLVDPKTGKHVSVLPDEVEHLLAIGYVPTPEFKARKRKERQQLYLQQLLARRHEIALQARASLLIEGNCYVGLTQNFSLLRCLMPGSNVLLVTEEDCDNCLLLMRLACRFPDLVTKILLAKKIFKKDACNTQEDADLKNLCKLAVDWICSKTSKLDDPEFSYSLVTRLRWIFDGMQSFKRCCICNSEIGVHQNIKLTKGYPKHCSAACVMDDEDVKQAIGDTTEMHYGVRTFIASKEFREEFRRKHGVEFPFQDEEIRQRALDTIALNAASDLEYYDKKAEKAKATFTKHYGVDHNMKSEEGYAKWQQGVFDKYGVMHNWQSPIVKEHIAQTNIERYGYPSASQSPEVQAKAAQTNMSRYGCKSYFQTEEFKEDMRQYNMENFGVEFTWQREDVKEKSKQSHIEHLGVEFPAQSPEVRDKTVATWLKNFGVDHPMKDHDVRAKARLKYTYDGQHFDSSEELAYYIWLKDKQVEFKYQPDGALKYELLGKEHFYFPDFFLIKEAQFVEIKGAHFFRDDGTMFCPYKGNATDEEYELHCQLFEAKHQCMLANGVKIIRTDSQEMKDILAYIKNAYGSGFLAQQRNKQV